MKVGEDPACSASNQGMRELGPFGVSSGPSGVRAASAAIAVAMAIGRNWLVVEWSSGGVVQLGRRRGRQLRREK